MTQPNRAATLSVLLISLLTSSLATVSVVGVAGPAPAGQDQQDARTYAIETFAIRLELSDDSRYTVEERLTFRFHGGTFTRGYRSIPADRIGSIGRVEVSSSDTDVSDVEHGRRGGNYTIEWSYPERADPVTFVLRYEVEGALLAADGENIIDWDAVGRDWDVPIEDVRVVISWPDLDLTADEIRTEPGEEASLERTGAAWTATFVPGSVEANTPYRVLVRFPQRLAGVEPPNPLDAVLALVPFIAFFLLGLVPGIRRYLAERDPADPAVGGAAERPELPLHEAALLTSSWSAWSSRVFPSILVGLTRRAPVRLRRVEEGEERPERLEVSVVGDISQLSRFEADFLEELAKHGSFQEFMTNARSFQSHTQLATMDDLVRRGLLTDLRGQSKQRLKTAAVVAIVALGMGVVAVFGAGAAAGWAATLGLGASMGLGLAATRRYRLTAEHGAPVRARILAFQEATRDEITREAQRDPRSAAILLAERLDWILIDGRASGAWMAKLNDRLEAGGVPLTIPPWLSQAVGKEGEAPFEAYTYFVNLAHPLGASGAAADTGAAVGISGAGVGASGGVGGGGGGVS